MECNPCLSSELIGSVFIFENDTTLETTFGPVNYSKHEISEMKLIILYQGFLFSLFTYFLKVEMFFMAWLVISSRCIDENLSKIRDVERELANLTMEMKLTSGPKKAG